MKRLAFLLGLLLVLVSCKNEEKKKESAVTKKIETQQIRLDSSTISACREVSCAGIKVDYLKSKGDSSFSQAVNQKNEQELIRIFNITPDEPEPESVEAAVNNFVKDYIQFKKDFPDSRANYEAEVAQEILNPNDTTLVFKTSYYLFTGGAHGFSGINFQNFDRDSGKFLTKDDLISDIPAFKKFAEEKFRDQYDIPADTDINSKGFFFDEDKFALPHNIAVTDDQVILLYNPYEAASYAQGVLRLTFSKEQVGQWLNY